MGCCKRYILCSININRKRQLTIPPSGPYFNRLRALGHFRRAVRHRIWRCRVLRPRLCSHLHRLHRHHHHHLISHCRLSRPSPPHPALAAAVTGPAPQWIPMLPLPPYLFLPTAMQPATEPWSRARTLVSFSFRLFSLKKITKTHMRIYMDHWSSLPTFVKCSSQNLGNVIPLS